MVLCVCVLLCMTVPSTTCIPMHQTNSTSVTAVTSSSLIGDGDILYVGGNGPDNYTSIQAAVDDANDGDTVCVYDDSSPYRENVVVEKAIQLVGEDSETTVIDGGGNGGAVIRMVRPAAVNGFTITGGEEIAGGIKLEADGCTVTGNIVSENGEGIVVSSSNNNITQNIVTMNRGDGIRLSSSHDNIIANNTLSSNTGGGVAGGYGIHLDFYSSHNTVVHNHFFRDGIVVQSYGHVVAHNTANGKPLLYMEGEADIIVDGGPYGQIVLVGCRNITVQSQRITMTDIGIELFDSRQCHVSDNTIRDTGYGIMLLESTGNHIEDNEVDAHSIGVCMFTGSNGNLLTHNTIASTGWGIRFLTANDNHIYQNTVQCFYTELRESHCNQFLENNFYRNSLAMDYNHSFDTPLWTLLFYHNRFVYYYNSMNNSWDKNFWGRPRLMPKLIIGARVQGYEAHINIRLDLHPSQQPYEWRAT